MRLVFTKGPAKMDWMDVYRDGRPVQRIDCPKQRIIPHDMVHYAVEVTLEKRGFLTRVAGGESAEYGMQAEPASDAVERLVEVFQGDAWSGGQSPAQEMLDLYRVTCNARACPMLDVSAEDIDAVRREIAVLDVQWQSIPVGGALSLSVDLA